MPPKPIVKYPVLYARTKNGGIKWYFVTVHHKAGVSEVIRTKASKLDGKSQIDIEEVTEGVNIGKANATSRAQQAINRAESIIALKKDEGYKSLADLGIEHFVDSVDEKSNYIFGAHASEDLAFILNEALSATNTDASGRMKPMLAHTYEEGKVIYPCYGQPKLDGVCSLDAIKSKTEVELVSRQGNEQFAPHIAKELAKIFDPGDMTHGELYSHEMTFQDIISAVKNRKDNNTLLKDIKLVVYDMPTAAGTFKERYKKLLDRFCQAVGKDHSVILCETVILKNITEVKAYHDKKVSEGYEGIMLRNMDGMYEAATRSHDLLKYKVFAEHEFEIIDVIEATGRDKGTAIFVCINEAGATFNVRPEGSKELRTRYFKDRKLLIGKKLTVKHQEPRSTNNIPRFPVGKAVRDYE